MQSRENIIKTIEQKEIKFISLQFTDIKGQIKSLELPVNQIEKILDNKITFDGSSVSGFRENETMDLVFYPDISTFKVYPDNIPKLKNTARFICDIYNADGTPFEGCPRCNGIGYRGRMGIFEIFIINEELQQMIYEGRTLVELRTKARELGMRSMREDGVRKVISGLTTADEVLKVTMNEA